MSSTCPQYFTSLTQYDIPVREVNKFLYIEDVNTEINEPCNTWICNPTTTEYNCMGLNMLLDPVTNQYIYSFKTLKEWAAAWQDGSCLALFQDMVVGYGTTQTTAAFSTTNFGLVQDDFNFMLSRYFNQDSSTKYQGLGCSGASGASGPSDAHATPGQTGGKFPNPFYDGSDFGYNSCNVWVNSTNTITIEGQPGYNEFLDVLLDACENIPGACQDMQNYMCNNCSREQVTANPSINKFCGCITAANSGGNRFYNSTTITNYTPSCDPLCNQIGTIKNADPVTGVTNACNANVCVMDAVQINAISSKGVVPSFNQVCPACADGQGNCICIIDATFDTTISSVKGVDGQSLDNVATFNQYCPNSQCYIANPNTGEYESVACSDRLPKSNTSVNKVKVPLWIILTAIIVILVAFIAIIAMKYQSNNIQYYLLEKKYI